MDEVGRGALAGPVSVGVVVVDLATRSAPVGVRDSKLLPAAVREALAPRLRRWARAYAVGHAEPEEIDLYGIIAALRLAGRRALAALPFEPDCVVLDGSHDWLSLPTVVPEPEAAQQALFEAPEPAVRRPVPQFPTYCTPAVHTMIKADLRCAAVAAASVLAKVERDRIMVERSALFPGYRWELNKGYSAPEHAKGIRLLGPCEQHRRTWSLPGGLQDNVDVEQVDVEQVDVEQVDVEQADVEQWDVERDEPEHEDCPAQACDLTEAADSPPPLAVDGGAVASAAS